MHTPALLRPAAGIRAQTLRGAFHAKLVVVLKIASSRKNSGAQAHLMYANDATKRPVRQ
ncbi:hypothetical protein X566_14805 [Afipia sp. P52-10]|nr:hypothetical protein X566_14805 [Afipia sp. P52-10]